MATIDCKVIYQTGLHSNPIDSLLGEVDVAANFALTEEVTDITTFLNTMERHMGMFGEWTEMMETEALCTSIGYSMFGVDLTNMENASMNITAHSEEVSLIFSVVVSINKEPRFVIYFIGYYGDMVMLTALRGPMLQRLLSQLSHYWSHLQRYVMWTSLRDPMMPKLS
jgi:hypothetical protein